MAEGGWLEPPESPAVCHRDSERLKREAMKLQSDILLELVVKVRGSKMAILVRDQTPWSSTQQQTSAV